MEHYDASGEDTELIEYEAPRILERVTIEAKLALISG
jgi:hypothetical protein